MARQKNRILGPLQLAKVARLFDVLGEPSRLLILQHLCSGPMSVNQLAAACRFKQANVSKQLGILRRAHLVSRRREGNTVFYRVSDQIVYDLCHLVCDKLRRDASSLAAVFDN